MPARPPESHVDGAPGLAALCRALSLAVPLVVAASRTGNAALWRDDLAVVRALGFEPLGGEGAVSALAGQLFSLLPIGGRVLRAGLAAAVGTGLAGLAVHDLLTRSLGRSALPRLRPLLGLIAALTATLAAPWQLEGTGAGGATLAGALALATLLAGLDGDLGRTPRAVLLGGLAGAAFAEQRLAAGAAVAALAGAFAVSRTRPGPRALGIALATAAGAWAFLLLPHLLGPARAGLVGVVGPSAGGPSAVAAAAARSLPTWVTELGPIAGALAVLGLAGMLHRREERGMGTALAILAGAGALSQGGARDPLSPDGAAAASALALAASAVAASRGTALAAELLLGRRVRFGEAASALLVALHGTVGFVALESTREVRSAPGSLGAEAWTDEALLALPAGAVVVVRTEAIALRIWSARVSRGLRPDLVVVPLGRLADARLTASLLQAEPALAPAIREAAITGRLSEAALVELADARPLFVELDPSWDPRLLSHLRPDALWLSFAPHPLSRSERATALADAGAAAALHRIAGAAGLGAGGDAATRSLLAAQAEARAAVLAALGDRDEARRAAALVARLEPGSTFPGRLDAGLASGERPDLRALLR